MAKVEIPIQVNVPVEELIEYLKNDGTLVEVVRCKECKFNKDGRWSNGVPFKYCDLEHLRLFIVDDWFCADGKRKEQDDE